MSSTGTAGRSASKAGFVLTAVPIVEADTLHDRVPAARVRPARSARRDPTCRRVGSRARTNPRRVHEERHLCADTLPLRDVRVPAGTSLRVHATPLRLLPRAAHSAFGRRWEVVGAAQIIVAVATAWVVYEIGRRVVSNAAGLLAAALATLHPYLIWHDVHVNREILDQFLAAAIVLLVIVLVERRSFVIASLLGIAFGLAILGNARLALFPIVLGAFVLWRVGISRQSVGLVATACVVAAVVVAPWMIRNDVSGRLLHGHDRRSGTLEGEQPEHVRHC